MHHWSHDQHTRGPVSRGVCLQGFCLQEVCPTPTRMRVIFTPLECFASGSVINLPVRSISSSQGGTVTLTRVTDTDNDAHDWQNDIEHLTVNIEETTRPDAAMGLLLLSSPKSLRNDANIEDNIMDNADLLPVNTPNSGGSKGGVPGAPGSKFFHFQAVFSKEKCKIICKHTHFGSWRTSSGKSWIRHCQSCRI